MLQVGQSKMSQQNHSKKKLDNAHFISDLFQGIFTLNIFVSICLILK